MPDKRLSTPVGTAVFPALKRPDTKFDELGIYKADLAAPLSEAEGLMAELTAIFKGHTGKAPSKADNTMWYLEEDKESGEPTGNVVFKLRIKNRIGKDGKPWDRRPKQFDARLKPIDVNPWGGTKMIVSFDVYEWNAGGKKGVSLQPVGVQIIDLKAGGGGSDPSAMGFAAQDGYVGDDTQSGSDYGFDSDETPDADDGDY